MNFDWIAPYYDTLASMVFGGSIKQCQIDILRKTPPTGVALIIGGGTGWIIEHIFREGNIDKLTYVDSSEKMLKLSKKRCPQNVKEKVVFILGDENSIPNEQFDCIITNFFLDCFGKVRLLKVFQQLSTKLKSGGKWYISDFYLAKKSSRFEKMMIGIMYRFFRVTSAIEGNRLSNFSQLFENEQYRRDISMDCSRGFIKSIVWIK